MKKIEEIKKQIKNMNSKNKQALALIGAFACGMLVKTALKQCVVEKHIDIIKIEVPKDSEIFIFMNKGGK